MPRFRHLVALTAALCLACGGASDKLCHLRGDCTPPPPDAGDGQGCATDSQCGAPTPRCLSGKCVGCLTTQDCSAGICDPELHTCLRQPDACSTAQPVTVGLLPVTVTGDTTNATDDTQLSCALAGSRGNDLVYTFHVDRAQRVTATITPKPGSALRPVLELRQICNSLSDPTAACAYSGVSSGVAVLSADVSVGTWFLWVDGEGDSAGAFTLELKLEDVNTAESCSTPQTLLFVTGSAMLTSDTTGHTDDSSGACGGAGAADAVYAFMLTEPQRVSVQLEPLSTLFAPALYVRGSNCADTSASAQIWCSTAAPGQPLSVDLPRLEPGPYHLFVDGAVAGSQGSSGPYRLTITLLDPVPPPTNDTCLSAAALPVPANGLGVVSVQGDTTGASGDATSCQGTGKDLVYRLDLSGPRRVGARVTPLAGSTLRPAVYLRQVGRCDSEALADQLGCSTAGNAGTVASLVEPSLPAGSYYLWVDGVQQTQGAFDLTVELQNAPPPPSNDSCPGATLLPLQSGVVTVNGTTVSAGDDAQLDCVVPRGAWTPDVVYTLDLPVAQAVAIDVTAASGSPLKPVLALRAPNRCSSNDYADGLVCAWGDPQFDGRAVYTLPSLDPGTYSLWVEGDGSTQGDFTVRVTTSPPAPPPANDWCLSSSIPTLTTSQALTGDTRAAFPDSTGSCGLGQGGNGEYANDVVYRFTLLTTQTVKLTVTPDAQTGALFRPVVYVRSPGGCSQSSAQLGCAAAQNYGDPVSLTLSNLPSGTYSVWVDGAGLSSGSFSIRLQ